MKVQILAIGAHPDDVDLSCGGTLIRHAASGGITGIVDLTKGELGTRGTPEIRRKEAADAANILGAQFRTQLDLGDGEFFNDAATRQLVIVEIRKHRPDVVLCNAIKDRHPDHARAAQLVQEACFYSGLRKITTVHDGKEQEAWRPRAVYHYIQDEYIHPDFVLDVSDVIDVKHKAIMAFASQFYDPNSREPQTPNSGKEFLEYVNTKMSVWGRAIGARYAEGFTVARYPGVRSLFDLL